jgi:hypothetical protein
VGSQGCACPADIKDRYANKLSDEILRQFKANIDKSITEVLIKEAP